MIKRITYHLHLKTYWKSIQVYKENKLNTKTSH